MFVVEWIYGFFVEFLLDFLAQHVYVGLVDFFAFVDQLYGVVYTDIFQLFDILIPEFIQNKQQFFSSTSRKYR